jgi:type IV pilus biogenesis protein PilP
MKKTIQAITLLTLASAFTPEVFAQAPATSAVSATSAPLENAAAATGDKNNVFRQLDALKTQEALLAAQVRIATLQKQLRDAHSDKGSSSDANQPSAFVRQTPMMVVPENTPDRTVEPKSARVRFVGDSPKVNNGQMTATIVLPNGGTINATVGTKVPGYGTVTRVSVSQVLYRTSSGQEDAFPFARESDGSN